MQCRRRPLLLYGRPCIARLTPAAGEAGGDGAQKLSISPALQDLLRQQPEVRRLLLEGLNAAALGDGAGASGRKR